MSKRLAFERPDGSGPQKGNRYAQVLFYFGPHVASFRCVFEKLGQVLVKGDAVPGAGAADGAT